MDDAEVAMLVRQLRATADMPEDGGLHGLAASIAGGPSLEGAACVGWAPLFDADVHGESHAARAARHGRARRICRRCPVRNDCRDAADAMPPTRCRTSCCPAYGRASCGESPPSIGGGTGAND